MTSEMKGEKKGRRYRGMTWSLCMIVKNEESVLARCLKSAASLADQMVVVDTGSAD